MCSAVRRGKRPDIGAWDIRRVLKSCRRATKVRHINLYSDEMKGKYNNFDFTGDNWLGVQLDQFANCESNLATNRQTRMMSDLALVGCYNRTSMPKLERDRILLASAKRNLASMAYFGLTEHQKVRQLHCRTNCNLNVKITFIRRYLNTCLRKPSTCALPFHSNSTIRRCRVRRCAICGQSSSKKSNSSMRSTLNCTSSPRNCCSKDSSD